LILRVRFNRKYHQLGKLPPFDWVFGLPDLDAGATMWKGERIQPGVLINFSHDGRLDVTNSSGPFSGYVISVNESLLEEVRIELGLSREVYSRLRNTRFWSPASCAVSDLRSLARLLCTVARSEGENGLAIWEHVFSEGLPAQLLRATAEEGLDTGQVTSKYRVTALKRALEVVNQYENMPESVNTLCEMTGASWSTLERAFKEEFGVGPKAYLKIRRLTAVRSEIVNSGPGTKIHEVANRWGFWHMGSFAADYRKQFGELPSDTLKGTRQDGGLPQV
jgi:AraC-like DNA-binding protein